MSNDMKNILESFSSAEEGNFSNQPNAAQDQDMHKILESFYSVDGNEISDKPAEKLAESKKSSQEKGQEQVNEALNISGDSPEEVAQLVQLLGDKGESVQPQPAHSSPDAGASAPDTSVDVGSGENPDPLAGSNDYDNDNAMPSMKMIDDIENEDYEREDQGSWENDPDEDYRDHEQMTQDLSGGLNKRKSSYKDAEDGDNPMDARESSVKEKLKKDLDQKKQLNKKDVSENTKDKRKKKLNEDVKKKNKKAISESRYINRYVKPFAGKSSKNLVEHYGLEKTNNLVTKLVEERDEIAEKYGKESTKAHNKVLRNLRSALGEKLKESKKNQEPRSKKIKEGGDPEDMSDEDIRDQKEQFINNAKQALDSGDQEEFESEVKSAWNYANELVNVARGSAEREAEDFLDTVRMAANKYLDVDPDQDWGDTAKESKKPRGKKIKEAPRGDTSGVGPKIHSGPKSKVDHPENTSHPVNRLKDKDKSELFRMAQEKGIEGVNKKSSKEILIKKLVGDEKYQEYQEYFQSGGNFDSPDVSSEPEEDSRKSSPNWFETLPKSELVLMAEYFDVETDKGKTRKDDYIRALSKEISVEEYREYFKKKKQKKR